MVRRTARCAMLAALLTGGRTMAAQPLAIEPGARVRVLAPTWRDRPAIGRLSAVRGDSLLFTPTRGDTLVRLPLSRLTRLEVSAGRDAHRGRGLGALIGFGTLFVGGLVCLAVCPTDPGDVNLAPVGGLLYGLFIGAPVGALLGGRYLPTDRWQPVPLPASSSVPAKP